MEADSRRTQQLIDRPGESLSVELKRWIDPRRPDGIEKLVRALLALRNHGGGYLVIGFDNDTLQPDEENIPDDVKSTFHIDTIQGIVSHYASEPFEVSVDFPQREGQLYPIIVVPPGVKTPVATRSDLYSNGVKLISTDEVYVRSLRSNNTPSTTKVGWKDWASVMEVCFDNRDADIGRFVRRHLSGIAPDIIQQWANALNKGLQPEPTPKELLRKYLQGSDERFTKIAQERVVTLPDHGTWSVALLLVGHVPAHPTNQEFLNLLDSSNPDYTGWPVWLDSRGFRDESSRPYVFEGVWETFIHSDGPDQRHDADYMRMDPKGRFYHRRALQEDTARSPRSPAPLSILDFLLPIIRSAEAMAVGIAFAKAMGCDPETTTLAFAFRWTKLRGRELASWAQPLCSIPPRRRAYQDDFTVFVNVPLDTPLSALSSYVNQVVQPLYEVFDGFSLSEDVVEDLTRQLVERRL
jgi:hypothetical protein